MHFSTFASLIITSISLTQAQSTAEAATPSQAANAANAADHWCGDWAGSPKPGDVPSGQLLPYPDPTRRFFVEPQLTNPPFQPLIATEPKVQIPKIWGNNQFRVALLSYATSAPAYRIYSSSKSRWTDFHEALQKLMTECVSQGTGGAYLVPPTPSLKQSTLVVYAYNIGSKFDFQMNYYMSTPYGIDPSVIGQDLDHNSTILSLSNPATTLAPGLAPPSAGDTELG